MAIDEKLIRALYKEFDPNLSANKVEAQIRFINRTYTSQDKFVEDFYSQYETELTPKIKKNISIYFGGFKPDVQPTIDVDDIDISVSPEAAELISIAELTSAEQSEVNKKFGSNKNPDFNYFTRKNYEFAPTIEQMRDMGIPGMVEGIDYDPVKIKETNFMLFDDLGITQEQHNNNFNNQIELLLNPSEYSDFLNETEINNNNAWKNKNNINFTSLEGITNINQRNAINEEVNKRLLEKYKTDFITKIKIKKIDNYIKKNADLFREKKTTVTSIREGFSTTRTTIVPDYEKFSNIEKILYKDIEKFKDAGKELKKLYDENEKLRLEIETYFEEVSEAKENDENFEIDIDESYAIKEKMALYEANKNVLLEIIPKLEVQGDGFQSLGVAADLYSRDYDFLKKNLATTALKFGDIGISLGTFFGAAPIQLAESILKFAGEEVDIVDNISLTWNNYKQGVKNSYAPDIKFADAFKNGGENFGQFVGQEIASQIPIFATMFGGGGIGTAIGRRFFGAATSRAIGTAGAIGAGTTIGISSATEQYLNMTFEELNDPFLEYSEAEKFLVSAGYGAAEGVFGTAPTYLLLRNTANIFTKSQIKEGIKNYTLKNIAFPMVAEPLSEGITQVTQNILTGRPAFENVDHAMFSGFMFSVFLNSAPAVAGRVMQKFSSKVDYDAFMEAGNEIKSIEKALKRKNSRFKKGTNEFNQMVSRRGELKRKQRSLLSNSFNNIRTKVTKRSFNKFLNLTSEQQSLVLQGQKIVDEGGLFLSKEDQILLESIQRKIKGYEEALNIYKDEKRFGNEFSLLQGENADLYDSYIKRAKDRLKQKGVKEFDALAEYEEASNIYFEDQFDLYTQNAKNNYGSNFKVFNTNKELIEYIENNPELNEKYSKSKTISLKDKNGKIKKIKLGKTVKQAILDGDINGISEIITKKDRRYKAGSRKNTIELISKENSLNNERAGTGYHELMHGILFRALGVDSARFKNIAEDILETLKVSNPKLYTQMTQSIGGQQANTNNYEEIIVNFIERVAEGKIDEKFVGVVAEALSRESGLNINFRSSADTIKFLFDLGLKIKDGDFKLSDIKAVKENLEGQLNDANEKVVNIKLTKFSNSDANIIQKIFDNLGVEGVQQIAENKYIKKLLNNISAKYRNVPGYNTYRKEFEDGLINDPVYGILGSLLDYNPQKNPVLISHIAARLKQRSKTIASQIFPQFFEEDVTEVKNVTEDATKPEVLKQRESLRISLGLSTDVINRVKQAVLKTFGGKLPNVTSKNFRSELQKSFRVFLKKTIAKNVLKQGAEYKAFLENNFEQIYSVLSQNTIRKRFKAFAEPVLDKDGKQLRERTPEGNKIFVKRKITKKEFVDYFLGENVGRSTQGTRKTALAEALAEEIAFDASLDVLRDPTPIDAAGNTILNRVEQIIEINGEQFSENYLAQVAKEIDRATGFKFSDSSEGITVLDFDDTVAVSKSKVIVNMPDKSIRELTPAQFAKEHEGLKKDGAEFDFSQFNKVIGGEKGPLFGRLQKAVNKFGNKNVFILTARPQEAAPAIKQWLESQGIALSEKNIVGLSDGSAQAKADWILGKAQEGFNNFYFADDVLENTYAVEQVLSQIDVKYRVDSQFSDSGVNIERKNIKQLLESFDGDLGTFNDFFKALIIGQRNYEIDSKGRVADRKGQALEYYVSQEIKGILGDRVEIVNEDSLKILKTGDTGIDIRLRIDGGPEFGIEIKDKFTDRVGSKSGYSPTTEAWGGDVAGRVVTTYEELKSRLEDKLNELNIPYETNEQGDVFIDDKINGKKVTDILKDNGFKFSDQELDFTMDGLQAVADLYAKKGGQYILFGDRGIFSLNDNPLNSNVESLVGIGQQFGLNTSIKTTLKTSDVNKAGKRKFFFRSYLSIVDSNGKKGSKLVPQSLQATDVFSKFSDSSAINLDNEINNIIEKSSGIKNIVRYSDTKGRLLGKQGFFRNTLRGGFLFNFRADDLKGLTYEIIKNIRGAEGNAAIQFFKEYLHRPFDKGMQQIQFEQIKLMDDFKKLKNKIKSVPKKLNKQIKGDVYTNGQAVRIYIWKKQGMDIPGIPQNDVQNMVNHVKSNLDLLQFAEDLIQINSVDGYPAPNANWETGNIQSDLYNSLNDSKRAKHLKEWQDNVNIIFSKENLNKMRVAYGNEFVKNLEDMLERMRTGRNRAVSPDSIAAGWLDWINGSVGAIMFYNMRSALLQTISAANYMNWSDNNILNAGKAFANQKQFWKDFLFIFNSDYLKVRRGGIKLNVTESEIADTAKQNGVRGVIGLILKNGFTPTRIADSLAISTGGATFYRNRVNTYLKQGISKAEAESKAFEDFMSLTEEGQQSSRPDKISTQQASSVGRILLAFANTPMQYNRLIKRAGQDLYYGRGDWKSNVSKIVYYGAIQNFIFNAMQKALYALGFGMDEDDPEKQREKTTNVFEGMFDSLLRGQGVQGQVALTVKGYLKDFAKARRNFNDKIWDNIFLLSPPFSDKYRKLKSAEYNYTTYANSEQAKEMSIRNPYLMAFAQSTAALTNLPLDRALRKAHNIQSALGEDTENWQRIALFLGWNEWDLGIEGMEDFSEFGKKPIKTEEYLRERQETKDEHQRKIDSIVNLGYTRIPLSGPKSFIPEGKLNEDYIRLRRKIDGRFQYFVPKEVFDAKFPPPPPKKKKEKKKKTTKDIYQEAKDKLAEKYGIN